MDNVRFFLDVDYGYYSSKNASSIEMEILGYFLASDVGPDPSFYKKYAFNDRQQYMSSNATTLEKQDGYILLRAVPRRKISN